MNNSDIQIPNSFSPFEVQLRNHDINRYHDITIMMQQNLLQLYFLLEETSEVTKVLSQTPRIL